MPRTPRRLLAAIAAWLVSAHVLLAYGLPPAAFLVLAALLGVGYALAGGPRAWALTLALLSGTLAYGFVLVRTGYEERLFHRPDERFLVFDGTAGHLVYEPGVELEMVMAHGDLRAMAGPAADGLVEPRHVVFRTDADGFRNERDYHGQRYVLVGDSFVAGTGNTQADCLHAQLLARHGIDAYSLACPGDPTDYAAFVRGFRARHGADFRVLLFVFEGNDFERGRGRAHESMPVRLARAYYKAFSRTSTYRVTHAMLRRAAIDPERAARSLETAFLAGRDLGFHRPYARGTREARTTEPGGFELALESLLPHLEHVYFVPTKYRVYAPFLEPDRPLSGARWAYLDALCRRLGVPCTDLTPELVRASAELLAEGELTWWRDDTHWNRRGIEVAARVVAADVAAAGGARAGTEGAPAAPTTSPRPPATATRTLRR